MAKSLKDVYVGVDRNKADRHENDFYPTPPLATFILAEKMGDRLPQIIIEPCAGRGHISAELIRSGRRVTSYDLNAYDDCLVPVIPGVDATTLGLHGHLFGIVTNPPYHKNLPHVLTKKFVTEYDFVAMFVRLTFLEGKRRKKLFTEHPPSDIIFLSDRVRFGTADERMSSPDYARMQDQIGGMIAYMWIIWDKKAEHQNTKCEWVLLEDHFAKWRANYEVKKNLEVQPDLGGHRINNNILDFMMDGDEQ